eukprot:3851185-Rhodomonas_salina.2
MAGALRAALSSPHAPSAMMLALRSPSRASEPVRTALSLAQSSRTSTQSYALTVAREGRPGPSRPSRRASGWLSLAARAASFQVQLEPA